MDKPRYIDANKIDFKMPYEYEGEEIFVSMDDVRKAIAQTQTEDVLPASYIDSLNDELTWLIGRYLNERAAIIKEFLERAKAKSKMVRGFFGNVYRSVSVYDLDQIAKEMGVEL